MLGQRDHCSLDGKALSLKCSRNSFAKGKIGFWTKSDSVSYFPIQKMFIRRWKFRPGHGAGGGEEISTAAWFEKSYLPNAEGSGRAWLRATTKKELGRLERTVNKRYPQGVISMAR